MRWREIPMTDERREMVRVAAEAAGQCRDGSRIVKFLLPSKLPPVSATPSEVVAAYARCEVGEIVLGDYRVFGCSRDGKMGLLDLHRVRYGDTLFWTDGHRAFAAIEGGA